MPSLIHHHRGVTLLELIITIGIGVALGGTLFVWNLEQLRAQRLATQRSEIENSTRLALRRVVKTIREAQPSGTGAYSIAQADPQTLVIYANTDADSGIERVRYFLSGTELRRGLIEPVGQPPTYPLGNEVLSIVSVNIQNGASPVFEYFDKNYLGSGPPLTQPVTVGDIRLVRMTLVVDADTTQPPTASTLVTNIQFRNLKDNY